MADERAPAPAEAAEWIEAFARRLELDAPDPDTVAVLLELAGVAAHASHRSAAPIACWLVGRAGMDPTAALDLARPAGAG